MKISLEIMMLAPFLVIVITGSEKALISSNSGQEERKKSHPTSVLCERGICTWLESHQYPKGTKVQVILSQAAELVNGGENHDPSGKQGCTLILVNLSVDSWKCLS